MYVAWFILFLELVSGQTANAPCTLLSGVKGECVEIYQCPSALDQLNQNISPEICSFESPNRDPEVCCLLGQSELRQYRKPGVLSLAKCEEFYPDPSTAILGGTSSKGKEFPHMALIGFADENDIQWGCGGSLISREFVLTAAHCLYSSELGPARFVRLGDLDISTDTDDADPQNFTVKRLIAHPQYQMPSKNHDIALIELDRPIRKTDYVSMACLDTIRHHKEIKMRTIGWGREAFAGEYSNVLLKANLDVVVNDKCSMAYKTISKTFLPDGVVDDWMICAGGTKKKDTCQGDSGGPLQVKNFIRVARHTVYNIVGVTSFGKACGVSNAPGIYTRVFNYLSWIEKMVWPSE